MAEQTTAAPDKTPEAHEKTRIAFIDIGRSLAALLVFYTHIPGPWVRAKGESAPYINFIEAFTSEPMHMARQGIGQVSVPFFFLVSGFVVTPLAMRQGHFRFGINRLIRVYLPLGFVLILTSLAIWAGLEPQATHQSQELTPWTMFTNWTLANYLIPPQVVLMPVAWTMIIEILFYILLFCLLPLLRRSVWMAIVVELAFIFTVLLTREAFTDAWLLFAVNISYLPIMIIGQVIWATTTKRVPLWLGGVFAGLAWMLYVFADIVHLGRIDSSYNLALAFAALCFMMGMFAEPKLKQRKFWTELSERSYSLYLLHPLGIFVILGLLRPDVPLWLSLIIMIGVTLLIVDVSYRFVERPSHRLARQLSHLRKQKRRPEPEPEPAREDPAGPEDLDGSGAPRTRRAVVPASRSSAAALASEITAELPRVPSRPPAQPPRRAANGRPTRVPPQPSPPAQPPQPSRRQSPNGRPVGGGRVSGDIGARPGSGVNGAGGPPGGARGVPRGAPNGNVGREVGGNGGGRHRSARPPRRPPPPQQPPPPQPPPRRPIPPNE